MVGIKLNKEGMADFQLTKTKSFYKNDHLAGKALYIDDDYVNYLYFKELFSETPYKILSATTFNQALQTMLLQTDISMVVISDLFMNGENAIFLRLFRDSFPDVPLVLMVYGDNVTHEKFSGLDFDLYINRQTDMDHLLESISELS